MIEDYFITITDEQENPFSKQKFWKTKPIAFSRNQTVPDESREQQQNNKSGSK